ncbi:hypothetical protein EOE18_17835 [Novosphingobium umbonatum]|uniref:Uncharacterized protein n=1 Tax=Novosphingobium umbonatum TaxID=1908524 RepID=A0A437MX23_9SPHN|nr:hypothetical protein [Novosphingobium umbonatum]RVU02197.1 hypothetical protein EOE18_17835 [Novosphingobium umbonatum]
MDNDADDIRKMRAIKKAQQLTAIAAEKLAKAKREARMARAQLKQSTARAPAWHAHRLSAHDREIGYNGEMSEARYYLRSMQPRQYYYMLKEYAPENPSCSIAELELIAVKDNLTSWTEQGKMALYEKARRAYEEECKSFERWAAENPDKKTWRDKPASKLQWMLILRTVDALELNQTPSRLTRGEAHDWLKINGANVRFEPELHSPANDASES